MLIGSIKLKMNQEGHLVVGYHSSGDVIQAVESLRIKLM